VNDDTLILTDHTGRALRLTAERLAHILEHPELNDQLVWIRETLQTPMFVVATEADETVHVYHRWYATTPVTSKYLLVVVKVLETDAFVLTAFFSSRQKKGNTIWQA
jgi:hypothetical protein